MFNPEKHTDTVKQQLFTAGAIAAIGVAAAYEIDQLAGSRSIASIEQTEPEMFSHTPPDAKRTLVLMGGFCMGTRGVAGRYKSQLASDVNMIAPLAPDAGFNPTALFESTYQELEQTNTQELFVNGLSMGGKLALHWIRYGWETGRKDLLQDVPLTLAFRGSPMDKRCVRVAPRVLLNAIGTFGYSYTLDHARPLLHKFSAKSAATAPLTRVVEEGKYLLENWTRTIPVKPRRVLWVRGMQHDPTINEDRAIALLQKDIGRPVEQFFDTECTARKHMPTNDQAVHYMLDKMGIAKPLDEPKSAPLQRQSAA